MIGNIALVLFISSARLGSPVVSDLKVPTINQNSSQWSARFPDNDTIKHCGCALCCLTMVHQYYGDSIDPNQMMVKLKDLRALTSGSKINKENDLMIWERANFNDVNLVTKSGSISSIDSELAGGTPVIVQVTYPGQGTHYVVIKGKTGNTNNIADPADPQGHSSLSFYGSTPQSAIHQVVIFRKGNARPNPTPTPIATPPKQPAQPKSPAPTKTQLEKFSVRIRVIHGSKPVSAAWVTFYGKEGFYRHVQTDREGWVRLSDVPGGHGQKIRIDVEGPKRKKREYYDQEIFGNNHEVSFNFAD